MIHWDLTFAKDQTTHKELSFAMVILQQNVFLSAIYSLRISNYKPEA